MPSLSNIRSYILLTLRLLICLPASVFASLLAPCHSAPVVRLQWLLLHPWSPQPLLLEPFVFSPKMAISSLQFWEVVFSFVLLFLGLMYIRSDTGSFLFHVYFASVHVCALLVYTLTWYRSSKCWLGNISSLLDCVLEWCHFEKVPLLPTIETFISVTVSPFAALLLLLPQEAVLSNLASFSSSR